MDDILRSGRNIYCVNADDNHGDKDRFGGYINLYSKDLSYKNVADALKNGVFYASEAPIINELWVEDNVVHVDCSDADTIFFTTGARHAKRIAAKDGEAVRGGEFELREADVYVRITVTDADGKSAFTNAYYIDEIFEKAEETV